MLQLTTAPLTRQALQMRALKLSLIGAPVLGAYVFSHTDYASPFFCPFRALTGIPCPGCGMTRSFLAMSHGDFVGAASYHALGPVLFVGLAGFAVHASLELATRQRLQFLAGNLLGNRRLQLYALLFVLCYHGTRLMLLARSGALAAAILDAPLTKLL
ncbi:MAG: DUF2752 domain-containing protein [Spirulinaceae cyanobacterium SM2_1_0]|nr:DUF2752 domain-containing protein [Spirulinaceae cyanobacterium SM2_1_0]